MPNDTHTHNFSILAPPLDLLCPREGGFVTIHSMSAERGGEPALSADAGVVGVGGAGHVADHLPSV